MNKLYKGDCLEVMKLIPDGSIDAIITDPPYGTTACKWDSVIDFELMWEQLNRIIKPYDWTWLKTKGVGFLNAKKMPLKKSEIISVFYNKPCNYYPQGLIVSAKKNKCIVKNMQTFGSTKQEYEQKITHKNYPNNLLDFKNDKGLHPTQKPVALMEYLIKTYTNENETVLDFTMGSGSTGVAAKNLNRNFIGIEMDDKYFDIATERINKEEPQKELF